MSNTLRKAMEVMRWVKQSWHVEGVSNTPTEMGNYPYAGGSPNYGESCEGACAEGLIEYVLGARTHDDNLLALIEDLRWANKSSADLDGDESLLVLDRYILEAGRNMANSVFRAWINEPRNTYGRCISCSLSIKRSEEFIPKRSTCVNCENFDSIPTWNDAGSTEESHVMEFFDVLEQFPLWRDLMATRQLNNHQRRTIAIGFVLTPTVTSDIRDGIVERSTDYPQNVLVASNVI